MNLDTGKRLGILERSCYSIHRVMSTDSRDSRQLAGRQRAVWQILEGMTVSGRQLQS